MNTKDANCSGVTGHAQKKEVTCLGAWPPRGRLQAELPWSA